MNKILILHSRGYFSSGPETYVINLINAYENIGYQVDLFCLDYQQNNITNRLGNLPKPIGSDSEYSYSKQKLSLYNRFRVLFNSFFNLSVFFRLFAVLYKSKYKKAVVIQYFGKLSPSILVALKVFGVKIFLRQSDFGLICSKNIFHRAGENCFKCSKRMTSGILNRCRGGLISSSLYYFMLKFNSLILNMTKPTIVWTNKNSFKLGSDSNVFKRLPNIINYTFTPTFSKNQKHHNYDICYIGRISEDKGINELIDVLLENNCFDLKILFVGTIDDSLSIKFNQVLRLFPERITHISKVPNSQIRQYIRSSKFMVLMSLWVDNLPNSLVESYSVGTPCILPNKGSFKEFIPDGFENLSFDSVDGLVSAFQSLKSISPSNYEDLILKVNKISHNYFLKEQHIDVYEHH
jgi:glycosyltransferase involved in cell wall biosynthesis